MEANLITAVVAAASAVVGGVITGIISPYVKHRLERSVAESVRKREQIARWRTMLLEVDRDAAGNASPGPILHLHPDYISLEPYLTEAARRIARSENRTSVVGQALCVPLETLKNEIARIEAEWRLRD